MKVAPHGNYFEGVLQIRHGTPELLEWIHNRTRADKKAQFTKEKKVPNGVDLYISDQHYLQALGKKIKERFFGILKVSTRIFTTNRLTSKHVYRVTVFFRLLPFKRGDIITFRGEQVEIMSLNGHAIIKYHGGRKEKVDLEVLLRGIQ